MTSIRDSNLFTLLIRPSPNPIQSTSTYNEITELVDESNGEARYLRVREAPRAASNASEGMVYVCGIYDAYSQVKVGSVSSVPVSYKARQRVIQLHHPDEKIDLEDTGKLSFEWTFKHSSHKFHWHRETFSGSDYVLELDRKPDPAVQVCLARAPAKGKDGIIQVLDYNLERFEIPDAKGLELVIYMSLMSIIDAAEDRSNRSTSETPFSKPPTPPIKSEIPLSDSHASSSSFFPSLHPTRTPSDLSPEDYDPSAPNEITINEKGNTELYAKKCVGLLGEEGVLFIVIRSKTSAAVGKVVEVADATKRGRHRLGLDQEQALYQYVVEDQEKATTAPSQKPGPKVIDLNDPQPSQPGKTWTPPPNVSVFLSKIELPELHPSRRAASIRSKPATPRRPDTAPSNTLKPPAPTTPSGSRRSSSSSSSQRPTSPLGNTANAVAEASNTAKRDSGSFGKVASLFKRNNS